MDSPTLFRFASGTGIMGESGPEAILPLIRGPGGNLGVAGGGSTVTVNAPITIAAGAVPPSGRPMDSSAPETTGEHRTTGSSGDPWRRSAGLEGIYSANLTSSEPKPNPPQPTTTTSGEPKMSASLNRRWAAIAHRRWRPWSATSGLCARTRSPRCKAQRASECQTRAWSSAKPPPRSRTRARDCLENEGGRKNTL